AWQSPPPTGPNNGVPVITMLSPGSGPLYGPDLTLTVNGSGFVLGSQVQWNGTNMATTYVSSSQLTALLPAELFAPFNVYGWNGSPPQITVFNPLPGGGTSNGVAFPLDYGVPTITSITPTTVTAGGFSFVLQINGTNLYGGTVYWNGQQQQTFGTNVVDTQAGIDVSAGMIANPGTATITIV